MLPSDIRAWNSLFYKQNEFKMAGSLQLEPRQEQSGTLDSHMLNTVTRSEHLTITSWLLPEV